LKLGYVRVFDASNIKNERIFGYWVHHVLILNYLLKGGLIFKLAGYMYCLLESLARHEGRLGKVLYEAETELLKGYECFLYINKFFLYA